MGSPTSDFHAQLSLLYARDCLAATADSARYDARVAFVTPDGRWRFPAEPDLSDATIASTPPCSFVAAMGRLTSFEIDVVVPQLFCLAGMTHYRALLDVLGLPYVGNRPDVMALTADKARARAVVAAAGIPVPVAEVLRLGEVPSLAPPVVVKPVDADNSHGLSLVGKAAEYDVALTAVWAHADRALVERYVELGREVRCGVIVHDGQLVGLPLEEYAVDPVHKPVRDARDKIAHDGDGELYLVAKEATRAWIVDPSDPVTERVWEVARRCHIALGCRHHSLFDFRIDPDGQPWFLEAGLYCSYADKSVVAAMARAAGIALPDLFATALDQALEKEI